MCLHELYTEFYSLQNARITEFYSLQILLMSFRPKVRATLIDFCTFLRKHAHATRALLERRWI